MGISCGHRGGVARCVGLIRKNRFIENDVSGNYDAPCGKVVAPVPFVFKGISEENTRRGARRKLMVHGGMEIWITEATEHAQVSVVGMDTVKKEEGCVG